jgi:hypothetical protein
MEKTQVELLRKLFQQKADEAESKMDLYAYDSGEYGYHYGVKVASESVIHFLDNPNLVPLCIKTEGEKV